MNGKPWGGRTAEGTYAVLRRAWTPGDRIELNLPMPVRLMQSHPAVRQNRNQVAVMRGPVVYCLELPLHLGGAEAWQTGFFLPENVEFTPRKEEEFLGGVTVLKGTALTFKGRDRFVEELAAVEEPLPQRQDWSNMLYRPLQPRKLRQAGHGAVPVTLIPYFAWANRGESYMEVWIPLAR